MKKVLFFSAFMALLLGATFIYSCQKEKGTAVVSPNAAQVENTTAKDRSGVCSTITVGRGVGLVICGTDTGTNACCVCGEGHFSETVTNIGQVFNFTGSSVFSLYNPTGSTIRVAIAFNCAEQAPQWFNIAPGATVSLTTTVINGCCFAVACNGSCGQ